MKTMLLVACLTLAATAASAQSRSHYTYKSSYKPTTIHVTGYTRSNGTYVQPHYQTTPNQTKADNWSSRPNVNPYTGKAGSKDPYSTGH